jgi:hypothetical protein
MTPSGCSAAGASRLGGSGLSASPKSHNLHSRVLARTLFHALAWQNVSHGRITCSTCSIDINTNRPPAIATASLDLIALSGPLCQARHGPTRTKDPSSSVPQHLDSHHAFSELPIAALTTERATRCSLSRAVRRSSTSHEHAGLLIEQGGHVSRLPIESLIASFQVLQLPKTDKIGTCISGRRHAFTNPQSVNPSRIV